MPGFAIQTLFGILGDPDGPYNVTQMRPFYSYTWTIPHLFGTGMTSHDSTVYAQTATLPSVSHRKEEVEGASLVYKYAKDAVWDDVRVSFYDTGSAQTLTKQIRDWRHKVWSPEDGIGQAAAYKKDTKITKFTHDLEVEESWTLHGSWPQSIRYGELTYTESKVNIVDVVITYDWATEE